MAALTDYQRDTLEGLFRMQDFRTMFLMLKQEYRLLGLGEEMEDDELIGEFKYITQNLRKYISSKQESILSHGADLAAMMAEVDALIAKAAEYGDTRRDLVYNFVRDAWLLEVRNGIAYLMEPGAYDDKEE